MLRKFLLVVWSVLLMACAPSARQMQAMFVNQVAINANATLPVLLEAYEREGSRAIAASRSREEALVALERVEQRWKPVWASWESLRVASDVYASALERGATPDAAAVRGALCRLLSVSKDVGLPAMPVFSLPCAAPAEVVP